MGEVAALDAAARSSGKRLSTLSIDAEVGFASAADRKAFAEELATAVVGLVARYHHDDARPYRVVVGSTPQRRDVLKIRDERGMRGVSNEIEVACSAEEAWRAVSTGEGLEAWFIPAEIEPRLGGATMQHYGPGMDVPGVVRAFEPGQRISFGPRDDTHTRLQTYLVEARGGITVIRVIESGFGDGSEWDAEIDAIDKGWQLFLVNLTRYLERFGGLPAKAAFALGMLPGRTIEDAWTELLDGAGADVDGMKEGDPLTLRPSFAPAVSGEVDRLAPPNFLGLVVDGVGLLRLAAESMGGMACVSVFVYLYGDARDRADELIAPWTAWFAEAFPMPSPA